MIAKSRLRPYGVKIVYTAESIPDEDEATQILLESLYEGIAASFIESHRRAYPLSVYSMGSISKYGKVGFVYKMQEKDRQKACSRRKNSIGNKAHFYT